jgi:hypothetical protein
MSTRKPYVIANGSKFLCVTCRASIKSKREAVKHECSVHPTWIVALNNKLTGERGIMGMIELTAGSKAATAARTGGIYGKSAFFMQSIAARAAEFREVTGERESIIAAYGPEIE